MGLFLVILASSVEELEFFRFLFFCVLFYAPNDLEKKKFYFLMFIHFRIYFDSLSFEVVLPREENVTHVNVVTGLCRDLRAFSKVLAPCNSLLSY